MNSKHMDTLQAEIQLGLEDAAADFPDVDEYSRTSEIINNMTIGHSTSVRNEMRARFGLC
jgi:hypothetical protein